MADASSLRTQTSYLPTPKLGRIRLDKTGRTVPVWADGSNWKVLGTRTVRKHVVSVRAAAAGDQISQTFFTAQSPVKILSIKEVHATASGVAGDVIKVWKTPAATATGPGTGSVLTTIALDTTANTVQTGTLTSEVIAGDVSILNLAAGDRLSISFVGTLTSLAGVLVSVELEEEAINTSSNKTYVSIPAPLNGDNIDQNVFVVPVPCRLIGVGEVHAVAGTNGSAVTLTIKKGGTSGTALTSAIDLKATANVPQTATLTTTASDLSLNIGDLITFDYTGTTTALAGVNVVLVFDTLEPAYSFVNSMHVAAGDMVDEAIFISPGVVKLEYAMETHGTATTGAGVVQLVKDTGTNAPGAGSDILNTAFDVNATADTPQDATWVTTRATSVLLRDNRLSLDYSASTAGGAKAAVGIAVRYLV